MEFEASLNVTCPLTTAILIGNSSYFFEIMASQISAKAEVASRKKMLSKEAATNLKGILNDSLKRVQELAQEKGASSGLTALPIRESMVLPFTRVPSGML